MKKLAIALTLSLLSTATVNEGHYRECTVNKATDLYSRPSGLAVSSVNVKDVVYIWDQQVYKGKKWAYIHGLNSLDSDKEEEGWISYSLLKCDK